MNLGVDIGGTRTKWVLMDECRMYKKGLIKSPKFNCGGSELVDFLAGLFSNFHSSRVQKIGISFAGPIDWKNGVILDAPHFSNLKNYPLVQELLKKTKVKAKIYLENDVNTFTLAEATRGAGQRLDMILGLAVGTGIGGGIVYNSLKHKTQNTKHLPTLSLQRRGGKNYQIYRGKHGFASEFGHMIIQKNGPKCSCGRKGCLEAMASISFLEKKFKKDIWTIEKRARRGEKKYKKGYFELAENLAVGVANLFNIFDPDVVVIGGGILHAWDIINKNLILKTKTMVFNSAKKFVKIKKSKLGKDFPSAIGAALL